MFNPLKGLGDIYKLQKMQKELQNQEITVEQNGVKVIMRGDQKIIRIEIDGVDENRIADTINEAVKKSQEEAARKLMEMSKEEE